MFSALPIEDKELRLDKPESATIAPGERYVKLIARELLTECDADGIRPNKTRSSRSSTSSPSRSKSISGSPTMLPADRGGRA